MDKIKVSLVSYLNSRPFLYGLQHHKMDSEIELDIPSVCAQKLISGEVDLGLVPIAVIPQLDEHYIISDYCIGAEGKVGSVMLYSDVPLVDIKNILLDYQSFTSVSLVKVLAKHYWKTSPNWIAADENYEDKVNADTAAVIIGDRTFGLENRYKYAHDLAEEWQKFTQLPFVFACWVSNNKLSETYIKAFNTALKFGVDNRKTLIEELNNTEEYSTDIDTYLNKSIQYNFDDSKKKAMRLFLDYISKLD